MTAKWWERLRFSHFGTELEQTLKKQPALKRELRDLFKSQKDKLSYFDLFQFIETKLKIKMKNWEEDSIENRLDKMGLAFIEFNEFNEFSEQYGIDWGEKLIENDIEALLEAKLNLSYLDYQLSTEDYFMGCQTMLTSEKAALAKVNQIYSDLQQRKVKKFIDSDFGPAKPSDSFGNEMALYKDGRANIKGQTDPSQVEWVYPEVLCPPGKKPMFVEGASSQDCIQGELGNCWFISAMSVLVTRDELLVGGRQGMDYNSDMIIDKELATLLSNGVYPPIFHRFRAHGLYVIRFFKNFKWVYVIIDDRIPVNSQTKKPVFGHCDKIHELWVALIEKAYAKLHGCYENLTCGYIDEGIQELTGFQPEKILVRNEKTGVFPHKMIE